MKLRFYFFLIFYTLLFLFYPGDSSYFHTFAYNRQLFSQTEDALDLKTNPVPILVSQYYPPVTVEGAYVIDLLSFTPLLERNPHERFLPASTTKILTALVAADVFKPDDSITVQRVITEGQVMDLIVGEKITVENLLYGILVHSANDAAYALADSFGYEEFLDRMNEKAELLGMQNSLFQNPAGLDQLEQYTTPFDLALAARALLENPLLKKIVATKEIIIADTDYKYFHKLSNVNKLLGEIQGIGGLKTGYTEFAGENLVSFYKNNGNQFLIILLKSENRFADTREIITWLNTNIIYTQLP